MSPWPIIHVFPNGTPSDAELEADRDVKHAAAVEKWLAKCDCPPWLCSCDDWPISEVIG